MTAPANDSFLAGTVLGDMANLSLHTTSYIIMLVVVIMAGCVFVTVMRSQFWKKFALRQKIISRIVVGVVLAGLSLPLVEVKFLLFTALPARLGMENPNLVASSIKLGILRMMLDTELPKHLPPDQKNLFGCAVAIGEKDAKQLYEADGLKSASIPTRDMILAEIQQKKSSISACKYVDQATPYIPDPVAVTNGVAASAERNNLGPTWFSLAYDGKPLLNLALHGAKDDAPMPIGGLSESITGIAIALLIQDHKLSLDSTVGDLLRDQYAAHHRDMDANLKTVTIEQLLTHSAGLPPNHYADPVHGLLTRKVLEKTGPSPTPFDYLNASNGDHASGQHDYLVSNTDYLLLGVIIEAVSGQSYETFCRTRILQPLGITGASLLGGKYTAISAYSGWVMNRRDMTEIWYRVFNRLNPTILSQITLDHILFAPLGQKLDQNDARFVMGASVKWDHSHSSYRLFASGEQATALSERGDFGDYFSTIEDTDSNEIWMMTASPAPSKDDMTKIYKDIRSLLNNPLDQQP